MDDLISRQQGIDALRAMQTYKMFAGDDLLLIDQAGAQTELMMLPPAEPEIIRCKDCKYYKFGICMKIGVNKSFHGFCDWAEIEESRND